MKKTYYLIIALLFVTLGISSQTTTVGPLLGTIGWNQEAPYNNDCPILGNGKKAFVGCAATAAGQVMKHHGYPKNGVGAANGFNFATTTYDWSKMLPTYKGGLGSTEQKAEVAQILRHLGAAMNMIYNETGSGSSLLAVRQALTIHFSYYSQSNIIYRDAYTDDEWFEVLKREIDGGRPIIFGGMRADNGSHIFVCDGYKLPSKELHFNYGWDGYGNEWKTMSTSQFNKDNSALIGVHPTTNNINPTITMFTAMNFSNYTPKRGETFNVAARIANYGVLNFNNEIGVALYQGSKFFKMLKSEPKSFKATPPVPQNPKDPPIPTYDLLFTDILVPSVSNGNYQLRIVAKSATGDWCPMQGLTKTVVKEANVNISAGGWKISYPLGNSQVDLILTKPIEAIVANNRAVVKFSIKNTEIDYDFKGGDIFVVASPNNKLIPATRKRINPSIDRGLTQDFEVTDLEIPAGTDVYSCRFSVVYNRIYPNMSIAVDKEGEIAASCVPLLPAVNNFKEYQIPVEGTSHFVDFRVKGGSPIPTDYKMYYEDGKEDLERKTWGQPSSFLGYATAVGPGNVRLVTSAISVRDENEVLEWQFGNGYKQNCTYRIYISTEGQEFKYFKDLQPAFDELLPNDAIARLSLSDYAGKTIYIMFQVVFLVPFELSYFKILNIKSPKDAELQSVNIPGSTTTGKSFPVKFTVKNNSAINIREITATYKVNGSAPITEKITTNISFNTSKELTFTEPVTVNNQPSDITTIDVRIDQKDEDPGALNNNNGSAKCTTVLFYPKKNILVFKSTKGGCAACMTSYTVMDDIDKLFPEAAGGVEIWQDGTFKNTDFQPYFTSSTPVFFFNSKSISDYTPSGVPAAARRLHSTLSPVAEVSVQADYENESSRKLKIKIKSRFATPLTGTYRMGAFIIENNIYNIAGQISGTHPTGEKLTKNHMPVGTVGGCKGATGKEIINPMLNEYIYDCEFTVPNETFSNGISYRNRRDNIQVIGVLFDSNGNVINASLNNYYIRIPKTTGLTFTAEPDYCPFKLIYDVEMTGKDVFVSEENYRSTIFAGDRFKFRIKKDASWNGKELRLVANPTAVYNFDGSIAREQVLFPDENGVYTLDNVNMHYYMRVDKVEAGERILSKNGSQLVMSGNWEFKNINEVDLSSPSLTGVDMTRITLPEGLSTLNTTNPNVLIYTAADAKVPASWTNVVKGTNADNIALKDGYPFYNSKEFTASSITYTREYPTLGWASGCLPFAVSTLPESIQAECFSGSQGTIVNFKPVSSLETNTPYIYKVITTGEKVFAATNATIPVTNLAKVTKGEYSFNGTFDKMSGADVSGLYMLSHDGSGFKKANETNNIPAYRSFIEYTGINKAPLLTVKHETGGGETGLDATSNNELVIRSFNNIVEIIAPKAQQAKIYSLDGRLIRALTLNEGVNTVYGLAKGLYIINNQKIAVR